MTFYAIVGVLGLALWFGPLVHEPQPFAGLRWGPWVVAILAFGCNYMQIEIRWLRSTASVGLGEIPALFGLVLLPPILYLPCEILPQMCSYWARRGFRPIGDLTDISMHSAAAAVMFLTFHAIGYDAASILGPHTLLSAWVAVLFATGIVEPLLLLTGATIRNRSFDRGVVRSLIFCAATSVIDVCIGAICLAVLVSAPWVGVMLIPPVAAMYWLQLGAHENRRRSQRIELLFAVSEIIHGAPVVSDVAHRLLVLLDDTFEIDEAELLLVPESGGERAIRYRLTSDEPSFESPTIVEWELMRQLGRRELTTTTRRGSVKETLQLLVTERGGSSGIASVLEAGEKIIGLLFISRVAWKPPSRDDEALLNAVALQVCTAFQAGELAAQVGALTTSVADLTNRALFDGLTRLANRTSFVEQLRVALSRFSRDRRPIGVLFVDLDGFKAINDTRGHDAGDLILCEVANRLRHLVRAHDVAGRLGGDEFVLLLGGMDHASDAVLVAERVVHGLSQNYLLPTGAAMIGASVGVAIAEWTPLPVSAESLIKLADAAMYEAKHQGKNRYVVFTSGRQDGVTL